MQLELLHSGKLSYRPTKPHKTPGDLTKIDAMKQWKSNPTNLMPGMHEVPHMSGTHGHVPKPGKPKWGQQSYPPAM